MQNQNSKATPKQWKDINGIMFVYARKRKAEDGRTFFTFSTSIGKKNTDGIYENVYFDVLFPKEYTPDIKREGTYTFDVKQGFLTLRTFDGNCKHAIMLMKYDILD